MVDSSRTIRLSKVCFTNYNIYPTRVQIKDLGLPMEQYITMHLVLKLRRHGYIDGEDDEDIGLSDALLNGKTTGNNQRSSKTVCIPSCCAII